MHPGGKQKQPLGKGFQRRASRWRGGSGPQKAVRLDGTVLTTCIAAIEEADIALPLPWDIVSKVAHTRLGLQKGSG